MSIDRADILIREARDRTGNQIYDFDQGVQQRSFVSYLNDAHTRIHNLIMLQHPSILVKEAFLDSANGTASYALPTDVHVLHNVINIDFSPTGNAQLYAPLKMRTIKERASIPGYPDSYFLRDGTMVVSPIPTVTTVNAFRINYQYSLNRLDIRRAIVDDFTSSTLTLLDTYPILSESSYDLENGWIDYVGGVTPDGTTVFQSAAVSSYDSGSLVISLSTPLTAAQQASITAAFNANTNVFLVFGKNTTTHSQLPELVRRYYVEYMTLRAQASGTSPEALATSPILQAIEAEITETAEHLEEDILEIPILNDDYLTSTEEFD